MNNLLSAKVSRLFDKDHHFNYSPYGESLQREKLLITCFRNLTIMSDARQHSQDLLISHEEDCLTAPEVIAREFVRRAMRDKEDAKKNLADALSKALRETGFDAEKQALVGSFFSPFDSVESFLQRSINCHLVKARGFPSFISLSALIETAGDTDQVDANSKPTKLVNHEVTPRLVMSLIKGNPHLLDDSGRFNFIVKLKDFSAAANSFLRTDDAEDGLTPSGSWTNRKIVENCLFNADLFLASEKEDKSTSLYDFCNSSVFPTRSFARRDLTSLIKVVTTSKSSYDLRDNNDKALKVSHNCFKCSSHASIKDEGETQERTDYDLANEVDKFINVNRVMPLDNDKAIQEHNRRFHSIGDGTLDHLPNQHQYLIACNLCNSNNVPCLRHTQFVCCLKHMDDHRRLFHTKELILVSLCARLTEHYKAEGETVKSIEKYLLCECVVCGKFFSNKDLRDTHQSDVCLPRVSTLSTYYGDPFVTEVFRSSLINESKRECDEKQTMQQLRLLTDELIGSPSFHESPDSSNALMSEQRQRTFLEIIATETHDDFTIPLFPRSPIDHSSTPSSKHSQPDLFSSVLQRGGTCTSSLLPKDTRAFHLTESQRGSPEMHPDYITISSDSCNSPDDEGKEEEEEVKDSKRRELQRRERREHFANFSRNDKEGANNALLKDLFGASDDEEQNEEGVKREKRIDSSPQQDSSKMSRSKQDKRSKIVNKGKKTKRYTAKGEKKQENPNDSIVKIVKSEYVDLDFLDDVTNWEMEQLFQEHNDYDIESKGFIDLEASKQRVRPKRKCNIISSSSEEEEEEEKNEEVERTEYKQTSSINQSSSSERHDSPSLTPKSKSTNESTTLNTSSLRIVDRPVGRLKSLQDTIIKVGKGRGLRNSIEYP